MCSVIAVGGTSAAISVLVGLLPIAVLDAGLASQSRCRTPHVALAAHAQDGEATASAMVYFIVPQNT